MRSDSGGLLILFSFMLLFAAEAVSQSGYLKPLEYGRRSMYAINLGMDEYHRVLLVGNYLHEDTGRKGLMFVQLDTLGVILESHFYEDTILGRSLDYSMFNELGVCDSASFLIQFALLESGTEGIMKYSEDGLKLFPREYIQDEFTEIYQRLWCKDNKIYILGFAQRINYRTDVLFMRLDSVGNVEVRKKIGYYSLNDYYGDSFIDGDGNFVVIGTRWSDDYIWQDKEIRGWAAPFVMRLDTAGNLLDLWLGEENDPRLTWPKRFFMTPDSGYVVIGKDFKEVPHVIGTIVHGSPTICKLDKDYNLLWKHVLSNFETRNEYLADLAYCPITDTYVTAGFLGVPYGDAIDDRIVVIKFDESGNILWSIQETVSPPPSGFHDVGGVVVSSTGSIYITGRQRRQFEEPTTISWLMKVTPDGCVDTICTTTSIGEQIAASEGWQVVFPNPVREEVRIVLPEEAPLPMVMTVYDLQGRIVDRLHIADRRQTYPAAWHPGMYGYTISHAGIARYVGKLVKVE